MKKDQHQDQNLKGTLISVFILGILIVLSWSGALALYVERQ